MFVCVCVRVLWPVGSMELLLCRNENRKIYIFPFILVLIIFFRSLDVCVCVFLYDMADERKWRERTSGKKFVWWLKRTDKSHGMVIGNAPSKKGVINVYMAKATVGGWVSGWYGTSVRLNYVHIFYKPILWKIYTIRWCSCVAVCACE